MLWWLLHNVLSKNISLVYILTLVRQVSYELFTGFNWSLDQIFGKLQEEDFFFFSDVMSPQPRTCDVSWGVGVWILRSDINQLPWKLQQYLQCKLGGWQRSIFLFILALGLSVDIEAIMRNIFVGGLSCVVVWLSLGWN